MFDFLKPFPRIIVTGPQRSGTRIAAKMIANDLEYRYIDEEKVHFSNRGEIAKLIRDSRFVLQCPAFSKYVHEVVDDETAVIFMRRAIKDIIASQKRVNWGGVVEEMELEHYVSNPKEPGHVISKLKYDFWDNHQKNLIKNSFDLEYESLSKHPMWIEKEKRKDFGAFQTSPN